MEYEGGIMRLRRQGAGVRGQEQKKRALLHFGIWP
jgi:hypothetical protein